MKLPASFSFRWRQPHLEKLVTSSRSRLHVSFSAKDSATMKARCLPNNSALS